MPPRPTAPCSLAGLLAEFRPCFTAPTFQTFIGLVVGLIAQARPEVHSVSCDETAGPYDVTDCWRSCAAQPQPAQPGPWPTCTCPPGTSRPPTRCSPSSGTTVRGLVEGAILRSLVRPMSTQGSCLGSTR